MHLYVAIAVKVDVFVTKDDVFKYVDIKMLKKRLYISIYNKINKYIKCMRY